MFSIIMGLIRVDKRQWSDIYPILSCRLVFILNSTLWEETWLDHILHCRVTNAFHSHFSSNSLGKPIWICILRLVIHYGREPFPESLLLFVTTKRNCRGTYLIILNFMPYHYVEVENEGNNASIYLFILHLWILYILQ